MNAAPALLQIAAVARILRISRPLALRLVKDGALQAQRTPQGLRVEQGVLARWVDAQLEAAGHGPLVLAKGQEKK